MQCKHHELENPKERPEVEHSPRHCNLISDSWFPPMHVGKTITTS